MPAESLVEVLALSKEETDTINALSNNLQAKLAVLEHGKDDAFNAMLAAEKEEIESK